MPSVSVHEESKPNVEFGDRDLAWPVVPHREITALATFLDVRVHSVVWRQWDALYVRCKRKKG